MHFKICKLQYGAFTDQKCSSSTPLLLRLTSEDFKPRQCHSLIVVLVRPFWSHFCCGAECFMLPKEEASGNLLSIKGCSWSATMLGYMVRVEVKWMAASASSPSPHCASQCRVFPGQVTHTSIHVAGCWGHLLPLLQVLTLVLCRLPLLVCSIKTDRLRYSWSLVTLSLAHHCSFLRDLSIKDWEPPTAAAVLGML